MSNVDTNEKKFCHSDEPTPRNLPQKLGFRENLKSRFHHEEVIFCKFDIKNKLLDLQNPHVATFRHQIALEMKL